ncbi:MAG: hypothetical protein DMG57_33540 [Acidobacteria bacterium]|nr:MAG: hypothetical protein DMG57_33540 [Acidobacteriota bacterium]
MGSFNPYYTGGDPSYFPAPHRGGKSGLRDLVRFIAGCAIVSMAITVAVMRLFWQAPAANLTPAQASGLKRTIPAVHWAVAIQEPRMKQGRRRRHEQTARVDGESAATKTDQLELPRNPQLPKIILDSPPLLPPFPTEHNIQVGTPRARLVRAFGKPDLSARTMQQEQLIETYVYEQPDRATFVRMRDGSVVSAYTARPRVRVLPAEPDPDF